MTALLPNQFQRTLAPVLSNRAVLLWLVALGCVVSTGCQNWPGTQQANLFQKDSDRLLNEFRAEKKRADELAAKNRILEQRLAESEKGIARQNLANTRPTSRPSDTAARMSIGNPIEDSWNGLSNNDSSRNGQFRSRILNDSGLPDARPGTGARLTGSASPNSATANTAPANERPSLLQWRPIRK